MAELAGVAGDLGQKKTANGTKYIRTPVFFVECPVEWILSQEQRSHLKSPVSHQGN